MSDFLYHTSCPSCGSRDNLAVYTDHQYCFGCGYTKHYNYSERISKKVPTKTLFLPDDVATIIPYQADEWIRKYGLTQTELITNRVVWSESFKMLIFLYVKDGILKGWQGRYFGTDKSKPKWWNQGNLRDLDWLIKPKYNLDNKDIIIVEDIVSAIKVGRLYNCKPLFGSYIDISTIYNIYKDYNIFLWLDLDKRLESYKVSSKLNTIGISSRVIVTKNDPKDYSTDEIRSIIGERKSTLN